MQAGHMIGFAIFLSGNFTALLAPETPASIIITTTVIGFLTMITQNVFAYFKIKVTQEQTNKDRDFDAHDRTARAAELLAQTRAEQELLAARAQEANMQLKLLLEQRTAELKTAIAAATTDAKT